MAEKTVRLRKLKQKGESYHYNICVKELRRLEADIFQKLNLMENLTKISSTDPVLVRKHVKFVDD